MSCTSPVSPSTSPKRSKVNHILAQVLKVIKSPAYPCISPKSHRKSSICQETPLSSPESPSTHLEVMERGADEGTNRPPELRLLFCEAEGPVEAGRADGRTAGGHQGGTVTPGGQAREQPRHAQGGHHGSRGAVTEINRGYGVNEMNAKDFNE